MLRQELRLKISSSTFWSDSMVVLHYIKSDSHRFHTFVANRIAVIHEGSTADDWRYVESKLNPADDASRGLNADEMISQERWMKGPDFLWLDESAWPTIPEAFELPERDVEIKRPKVYFVQGDVKHGCTNRLLERYSSWYKLKRAVAWILRLKQCLLIRYRNLKSDQRVQKNSLTVEEIRTAEYEVVKFLQRCHFSDEINDLTGGHPVKKTSSIYRLEPVMNSHGIVCAGGRLKYAEIPEQAKHQMILPKAHHVARLIDITIMSFLAIPREHVLSHMRQRFWIISARTTINEILRNCVHCKRVQGLKNIQRMADLPSDRVTAGHPPFTYVGVDCFGPFEVKRGRALVKRYGCLFTCLTTRAIHIEKLNQWTQTLS
ncbi:uncharacterized protein LOC124264595 [Haliotis rubra]|uniref:uncharacterized protein LOC124264595 n=1 Tax=Haliotis rubra TaxID=36100 RepID=UPI001EE5F9E8|nr:uncharacterized protein LOC124264595 [Haliotis rubra]